jgi:epoxyqueuosine reductase
VRLAAAIRARALDLGFDRVGVCDAAVPDEARHFTAWLEAGHHAGMGWLARGAARRMDPQKVLPGARSFVVVALSYAAPDLPPLVPDDANREADSGGADLPGRTPPHGLAPTPLGRTPDASPHGLVARYARGHDYHQVIGDRLAQLEDFIEAEAPGHRALAYVDTGPLLERMWAARAGIGWIGKNALVLNETMGSFFLLGLVITTLALPADSSATDRCGGCTRCIDACPTGAIVAPRIVDSRRCIAYQTIEHRGEIPAADRPAIGTRLFGCDDCQEACPYNHQPRGWSQHERGPALGRRPEAGEATLSDLLAMTEDEYRDRFRNSAMKRATFMGLRRNAALALGHAASALPAGSSERERSAALLERVVKDGKENPVLREQAAWALSAIRATAPRTP